MPARARRPEADTLAAYRARRDFSVTPEPQGGVSRGARPRLVVQRHFARREHFDLRLEMDGVLKSWAVTRGPSSNPADKRLAVRTEDHPLDYGDFEGLIPKGEYGGGTVMLWEDTTYAPENGDPLAALEKGEIKFEAQGDRMRGGWVLVRMKSREKAENWLLIKERDAFADADGDLPQRFETSVATGRTRAEIERGAKARRRKAPAARARKAYWSDKPIASAPTPKFVAPQLCETAARPPEGADWIFELKYDGYRLQLATGADGAVVYTRSGLDWTNRFPGLARAAFALPCRNALLDGEAVVFNEKGLSDFALLVSALEAGRSERVELVAFDLLVLDEADLRRKPLRARKALLKELLASSQSPIRYGDYIDGDGATVFRQATQAGAEGIIAKRADAPYRSGRFADWLKIKGDFREDVVIIGYRPSEKGESFASLVAAKETPEGLRYVGRIGTGYGAATRQTLAPLLARRVRGEKPYDILAADSIPKGVVYLEAPFPAEVRFGGWTMDGQMRQARFIGVREDVRAAPKQKSDAAQKFARVTHASRVVFPADGVTKGQIAEYYDAIAPRMAPHLADRPISLLRAPETVEELFFQRHPLKGMTKGILKVPDGDAPYIALDGALGLHTAAQFGAIEIHGWMSLASDLDRPDRMVFDLDPDEDLPFAQVRRAAVDMRDYLSDIGLKSWPMITGGKGVHVVLPLDRSLAYAETEVFAAGFARGLARQEPKRFVATMSKRRREGRIFIDWLRNKKTATAILPWSLRARPGATVATPLSWKILDEVESANAFDLRSALRLTDEWRGFFETTQTIAEGALSFMRGV
ncbi:DNA ligase D [Methylocystis echinoides]|uniref:DNA ligase (ATP) n=1 Tax=Methylocystis echinoides TaxID=29468 RepID=A0A9W6GW07_9HYPH|nr:DNA ligase D [Methylocystis echinoides]GLI93919.1 ATP-dependent DNA ligase [Methylocystis echinoides]